MNCGPINKNLNSITNSIKTFALEIGRNSNSIRLVAVSKFIESAKILEAYQAGQRLFGENRVQELVSKKAHLPSDIEWHMIGHLQTNKVKAAVGCSQLIHSVDSDRLLKKINTEAKAIAKKQNILIQVNISEEESKYGASLDESRELVTQSVEMSWVRCKGFMTISPLAAPQGEIRSIFSTLRSFRDTMQTTLQIPLPELSMGMSGDYMIAIQEGATLIRIGTAIFGERPVS